MDAPTPEDVRAELTRLYAFRQFRGAKLRRLLGFLVEEWLKDEGANLSEMYIGDSLKDETLTLEEITRKSDEPGEKTGEKWGYPKTRANLGHVRNRLRKYYETEGYRDPVIIKLNPGSYAPVIAYNSVSTAMPDLPPEVARLILRAKTAIDGRTLRGAWRALRYYLQIPQDLENPRQVANSVFIPMAVGSIIPSTPAAIRPLAEAAIAHLKQSGAAPWEGIFAEACGEACYSHNWQAALKLFDLADTNSQGEARYFWWHTAMLASRGRIEEAIGILDAAVTHFSRTNLAARTDLAILQMIAGRFADAEEQLSSSLEFTAADNPLLALNFALLFEAQDRLEDAARSLLPLYPSGEPLGLDALPIEEALERRDLHVLLGGTFAMIMGCLGVTSVATQMRDILLECKAKRPAGSSIELALAFIGLEQFDEAVEWLRKAAFEESDPLAMWFHVFPPLRHLHVHRGFKALLKDLNLTARRRL
jgi:tetratricopeptide (TPR) repeat protein